MAKNGSMIHMVYIFHQIKKIKKNGYFWDFLIHRTKIKRCKNACYIDIISKI